MKKKILIALLLIICTSGCTWFNEEKTETEVGLDELRSTTVENNMDCAVAYIGYGSNIRGFLDSGDADEYREKYGFIWDIPSENYVENPGDEIYCIVPASGNRSVSVIDLLSDEFSVQGTKEGETLYSSNIGNPILIKGNISDIIPNMLISINKNSSEVAKFSPTISLRDGSLNTGEVKVYDFTVYPEWFVREE